MQLLAAHPKKERKEMKKPHLVLAIGLLTLFSLNSTVYAQESIIELVNKKATEHNVPVALAQAVIKLESNYNPKVRGARGEYGLGQIRCSTAKSLGMSGKCDKLLDAATNLDYSMDYLRLALDKANGNLCGAANFYASGIDSRSTKTKYCRDLKKKMGG